VDTEEDYLAEAFVLAIMETVDLHGLEGGGQVIGQLAAAQDVARHDVDQQTARLQIRPCAPEELIFGTAVANAPSATPDALSLTAFSSR
jgi:hypothetical protein